MNAKDLARRLKTLRRTVLMLETELRQEHLDEGLLVEIEKQLEDGIASHPRCAVLRQHVDALRENTLTPRKELYTDTVRACMQLKDAIEGVVNGE
jgi:hypothetical protein